MVIFPVVVVARFCKDFFFFLKANWLGVYPKITIRSLRFVVTPKRSLLLLILLQPSIQSPKNPTHASHRIWTGTY